jgi:type IV secretory pathway TrbD component
MLLPSADSIVWLAKSQPVFVTPKRASASIRFCNRYWSIFFAAVSSVETAHLSSLHVSIMWFSCKLGLQIWSIGSCTLRAQLTSTSAVRAPSFVLVNQPKLDRPSSHLFE